MADHACEIFLLDAGDGKKAVLDGKLDLADDVEALAEEEVVVTVDTAAEGVFDGEDSPVGKPKLYGLEGDIELVARYGLAVWVSLAGSGLAVGARDTLVGDAQVRSVEGRRRQVCDRERAG